MASLSISGASGGGRMYATPASTQAAPAPSTDTSSRTWCSIAPRDLQIMHERTALASSYDISRSGPYGLSTTVTPRQDMAYDSARSVTALDLFPTSSSNPARSVADPDLFHTSFATPRYSLDHLLPSWHSGNSSHSRSSRREEDDDRSLRPSQPPYLPGFHPPLMLGNDLLQSYSPDFRNPMGFQPPAMARGSGTTDVDLGISWLISSTWNALTDLVWGSTNEVASPAPIPEEGKETGVILEKKDDSKPSDPSLEEPKVQGSNKGKKPKKGGPSKGPREQQTHKLFLTFVDLALVYNLDEILRRLVTYIGHEPLVGDAFDQWVYLHSAEFSQFVEEKIDKMATPNPAFGVTVLDIFEIQLLLLYDEIEEELSKKT